MMIYVDISILLRKEYLYCNMYFCSHNYIRVSCISHGHLQNIRLHFLSSISKLSAKEVKECCKVLELSECTTEKELREAFLKLAKCYHPDSGSPSACASKFAVVQAAYRKLRENFIGLPDDVPEILEKDFGIRHTAPQHRHYLSYGGVGYGTPSQRQKQYNQYKVRQAAEQVYDYRMEKLASQYEKTLVKNDATLARQYKTSHAIEHLVEDMIQESMSRGEFDNLPGSGKPMKYSSENPYVDSVTHKLNQILINNGFIPEWVTLDKEIKEDTDSLRKAIHEERRKYGPYPISNKEEVRWERKLQEFIPESKNVNRKIDKFNIIAPQTAKQKLHFQFNKEARKILENGFATPCKKLRAEATTPQHSNDASVFDMFWKLFSKTSTF